MAGNLDKKLIKSIQRIGQNYDIEKIVLFGSRARGDHKSTSDIDLAVFPKTGFNREGRITSDFDELETLLKIDVVLINEQIDLKLLENIRREGICLYERTKNKIT